MSFAKKIKFIIYFKIWISRTMSWVNMLNSGMILFLVLSKLQDYGFLLPIKFWFFPIYILVIILMIIFGYFEDKLGFFREESRIATKRNPQMEEILQRLKNIEEKMNIKLDVRDGIKK